MVIDRRLVTVEIVAEVVERSEVDGVRRLLVATRTLDGQPPLRSELRILDPDVDEDELVAQAVRHDLLEAAGNAERFRAADTLTDLQTIPRVPHEDRADALAKLVTDHGDKIRARNGPNWLRTMLASELRAVYADGERQGYQRHADEAADALAAK